VGIKVFGKHRPCNPTKDFGDPQESIPDIPAAMTNCVKTADAAANGQVEGPLKRKASDEMQMYLVGIAGKRAPPVTLKRAAGTQFTLKN
jgi:hypothetical protein